MSFERQVAAPQIDLTLACRIPSDDPVNIFFKCVIVIAQASRPDSVLIFLLTDQRRDLLETLHAAIPIDRRHMQQCAIYSRLLVLIEFHSVRRCAENRDCQRRRISIRAFRHSGQTMLRLCRIEPATAARQPTVTILDYSLQRIIGLAA